MEEEKKEAFKKNENILCYSPTSKNFRIIYEGTIMEVFRPNKCGRSVPKYQVQSSQWGEPWNRILTEKDMLKVNYANQCLQSQKLAEAKTKFRLFSDFMEGPYYNDLIEIIQECDDETSEEEVKRLKPNKKSKAPKAKVLEGPTSSLKEERKKKIQSELQAGPRQKETNIGQPQNPDKPKRAKKTEPKVRSTEKSKKSEPVRTTKPDTKQGKLSKSKNSKPDPSVSQSKQELQPLQDPELKLVKKRMKKNAQKQKLKDAKDAKVAEIEQDLHRTFKHDLTNVEPEMKKKSKRVEEPHSQAKPNVGLKRKLTLNSKAKQEVKLPSKSEEMLNPHPHPQQDSQAENTEIQKQLKKSKRNKNKKSEQLQESNPQDQPNIGAKLPRRLQKKDSNPQQDSQIENAEIKENLKKAQPKRKQKSKQLPETIPKEKPNVGLEPKLDLPQESEEISMQLTQKECPQQDSEQPETSEITKDLTSIEFQMIEKPEIFPQLDLKVECKMDLEEKADLPQESKTDVDLSTNLKEEPRPEAEPTNQNEPNQCERDAETQDPVQNENLEQIEKQGLIQNEDSEEIQKQEPEILEPIEGNMAGEQHLEPAIELKKDPSYIENSDIVIEKELELAEDHEKTV